MASTLTINIRLRYIDRKVHGPSLRSADYPHPTLTVDFLEKYLAPSNQAYTNLVISCGRLTNHHSRTLHMVYPKISRAILVGTL